MTVEIRVGHVLERLAELPEKSVHMVWTSVPYWGLRSYGTEPQVWGGDAACAHEWGKTIAGQRRSGGTGKSTLGAASGGNAISPEGIIRSVERSMHSGSNSSFCRHCGAWRGEHGLEPTLGMWLENEVAIWRAIRRVLRDDGTAWLNCGDAYASTPNGNSAASYKGQDDRTFRDKPVSTIGPLYDPAGGASGGGPRGANKGNPSSGAVQGRIVGGGAFKPKDRLMMPARLAIALHDDGWYLRDEIVWAKQNPMPTSVKDRTTPAHEMLYLLTKKRRYYYDAVAIMEPIKESSVVRYNQATVDEQEGGSKQDQYEAGFLKARTRSRRPNVIIKDLAAKSRQNADERLIAHKKRESKEEGWDATKFDRAGANKRSVWHLALEPFNGAHFATAPTGIVIPPILAGTSEKGVCPACGAPWRRVAAKEFLQQQDVSPEKVGRNAAALDDSSRFGGSTRGSNIYETTGWQPGCTCPTAAPVPATVLDPFGGAGTTALCADRLGRNAILIELNPEYAEIARKRLEGDAPMLTRVAML